jgi:hypothetical protein
MKPVSDAFTTHFFSRLDPDIAEGLTPRQRNAITEALRQSGPREHSVDLRWTLNMLFDRFYIVILAGRDLRRQQSESARRARADARKVTQSLLILLAFTIPAILVLAVLLYGVKCMLGINIFESEHLMDFLQ